MLTLYIDSSKSTELLLRLDDGVNKSEKKIDGVQNRAQMILPELEDFLTEQQKTVNDITEISIHTGPGSFTGLRVGAAIARTLSALLNIPINAMPPGSLPQTPGWTSINNSMAIERQFRFKNFKEALEFVNIVGELAESEGHHPDINLHNWNTVTLTLSTHAIGGLSENDFILAAKVNEILE